MLFHRVDFLIFFAVVWLVYSVLEHRWQNRLLLAASTIFYGSWDWRFLGLIYLSAVIDYAAGWALTYHPRWRRWSLAATLCGNLGILGFFKYFDFFTESLNVFLGAFGLRADLPTLHIIVPAGLSFYTFQTMSYTIDVYRGKTKACLHFPTFLLYVMYFPQLVAGPVERANSLIPRLEARRRLTWEHVSNGFWFILLGLFKKIAIADLCAEHVDKVFSDIGNASILKIAGAATGFLFQLFADFSGYTDMAVGVSLLLGIQLSRSFRQPLLSTSLSDFWRRWNMTLTGWFREYLYDPLKQRLPGQFGTDATLLLTFTLIGLWHGAKWTWVLWGVLTGLLIIAERYTERGLGLPPAESLSGWRRVAYSGVRIPIAFYLVAIPAVFAFRLPSLGELPPAAPPLGTLADLPLAWERLFPWVNTFVLLLTVEAVGEWRKIWPTPGDFHPVTRYFLYLYMCLSILAAGGNLDVPYVYFQF